MKNSKYKVSPLTTKTEGVRGYCLTEKWTTTLTMKPRGQMQCVGCGSYEVALTKPMSKLKAHGLQGVPTKST